MPDFMRKREISSGKVLVVAFCELAMTLPAYLVSNIL